MGGHEDNRSDKLRDNYSDINQKNNHQQGDSSFYSFKRSRCRLEPSFKPLIIRYTSGLKALLDVLPDNTEHLPAYTIENYLWVIELLLNDIYDLIEQNPDLDPDEIVNDFENTLVSFYTKSFSKKYFTSGENTVSLSTNENLPLKQRFLNAVIQGELGRVDEEGVIVTLKQFKTCFSDIKTDYINSFLPASTIERGRHNMSHTKFVFRLGKGVYRVHPLAIMQQLELLEQQDTENSDLVNEGDLDADEGAEECRG